MEIQHPAASNPAGITGGVAPVREKTVSGFDSELLRRLSLAAEPAPSPPDPTTTASDPARTSASDASSTPATATATTTTTTGSTDGGYLSPFQVQQQGTTPIGPVSDPGMTWEQYYQQYIQLGLSPQQAYGIDDLAPGTITPAQMQALGFKQETPAGGGGIFWVGPGAQGDAAAWLPIGD